LSETFILAAADLALDQALDILEMSPALLGGRLRQFMVIGADIGQLEGRVLSMSKLAS
jgi:hypothetical protein